MAMPDMPKEAWAQLDGYPLNQPPPGVTPDFENRIWRGEPVVIAGAVGIPLMLIMAFIRMYMKNYMSRRWVFDDTIFVFSLAGGLALTALNIAFVTGGVYGYHSWEVRIGDLTKPVLMRSLALQLAVPMLIWVIKLAVYSLIFYAFNPVTYIRWMVYAGVSISFCFYLAVAIVNGVVCGPKGGSDRLAYLAGMAGQECGDPSGLIIIFSITLGSMNLLNDLYLLVLPLPAIVKLRLPLKKKIGVMFIFLAGAAACVMSVLGLIYRQRGYSRDTRSSWTRDTTYQQIPLLTVTTIEYTVGVIIPCMAPFAKFSRHLYTSVQSTIYGSSFQRTSSADGHHDIDNMQKKGVSHTNTIDRMLAQMFPGQTDTRTAKDSEKSNV